MASVYKLRRTGAPAPAGAALGSSFEYEDQLLARLLGERFEEVQKDPQGHKDKDVFLVDDSSGPPGSPARKKINPELEGALKAMSAPGGTLTDAQKAAMDTALGKLDFPLEKLAALEQQAYLKAHDDLRADPKDKSEAAQGRNIRVAVGAQLALAQKLEGAADFHKDFADGLVKKLADSSNPLDAQPSLKGLVEAYKKELDDHTASKAVADQARAAAAQAPTPPAPAAGATAPAIPAVTPAPDPKKLYEKVKALAADPEVGKALNDTPAGDAIQARAKAVATSKKFIADRLASLTQKQKELSALSAKGAIQKLVGLNQFNQKWGAMTDEELEKGGQLDKFLNEFDDVKEDLQEARGIQERHENSVGRGQGGVLVQNGKISVADESNNQQPPIQGMLMFFRKLLGAGKITNVDTQQALQTLNKVVNGNPRQTKGANTELVLIAGRLLAVSPDQLQKLQSAKGGRWEKFKQISARAAYGNFKGPGIEQDRIFTQRHLEKALGASEGKKILNPANEFASEHCPYKDQKEKERLYYRCALLEGDSLCERLGTGFTGKDTAAKFVASAADLVDLHRMKNPQDSVGFTMTNPVAPTPAAPAAPAPAAPAATAPGATAPVTPAPGATAPVTPAPASTIPAPNPPGAPTPGQPQGFLSRVGVSIMDGVHTLGQGFREGVAGLNEGLRGRPPAAPTPAPAPGQPPGQPPGQGQAPGQG